MLTVPLHSKVVRISSIIRGETKLLGGLSLAGYFASATATTFADQIDDFTSVDVSVAVVLEGIHRPPPPISLESLQFPLTNQALESVAVKVAVKPFI